MRSEPTESLVSSKQFYSAFLISTGMYALYYARTERSRTSGASLMTLGVSGVAIGLGISGLINEYYRMQAEREHAEKNNQ